MTTTRVPVHGLSAAEPGDETAEPPEAEIARREGQPAGFAIGEHDFLLHGEPFRILSGALHYFRVHPEHWADRIRKARQMGLNTIETYVAWNAHAPRPGEFDLTGPADLGRFLDLIAAEGMYAIVRPGPYICAEWTNGGLPAWLFRNPDVGVRRDEPVYLAAVEAYFEHLAPVLAPRQIDRGGPIILVQIENEYGAYGSDKSYLRKLVDINRNIGLTVPLTTIDQPVDDMLENGSLPDLHKTASFGSRAAERLVRLRRHQPTGPLMCAEFWDGWFDDWGGHHHTASVEQTAGDLEELLAHGASVNIYMFHGGTNFGFTNGANDKGAFQPIITSYDYDAPLDEAGNPTPKYWAMRDVLSRYAEVGPECPGAGEPARAFVVPLRQALPLWDAIDLLGRWTAYDDLPTTDAIGQYDGFTVYRTQVGIEGPGVFQIGEVRDRAQVFLNRHAVGVLARDHHDRAIALPENASGDLELLVEDQGRVNYAQRLGEVKGLIGSATANSRPLDEWQVLPLDLGDIEPVARALRALPPDEHATLAGPVFARATFDLPGFDPAAPADLFLHTGDWGKGVAWINGFCLGRYWSRGPQRTLYVPGPVLRAAANEVVILELHAGGTGQAAFVAAADLGHTET